MPFQSYSDLQASVGNWLKRNNLGDQAADFIALAEAKLNRVLRVRQMRTFYSITPSQPFVTLPGDYSEAIRIMYGEHRLEFISEDAALPRMNQDGDYKQFTIAGNRLWLLTQIDGSTKLTLHYYQQFEALSTSNTSNWLLQDAPDIYLYASLMEAERFIKNDDRVAIWKDALNEAVTLLQSSDQSGQYSGSSMAMKAG